jgi:hypothetical protein
MNFEDGTESATEDTASMADSERETSSAAEESPTDEPVDRIEALEAENERLRRTLEAARRRQYRYTAYGLAITGAIALGGAALFAPIREILLALGFTGLFGAVLTYFLTPERFVSASVGERIYATLAGNEGDIVDDLMLGGEPVLCPTPETDKPVRLFVPQVPDTPKPDGAELSTPFITEDVNGLALDPTGTALYEELRDSAGRLPDEPPEIARVAGEALVEQFELVDAVDVDGDATRVTVAIDGSAYGPLDQFDHPVSSFLATALAAELDAVVIPTVEAGTRAEWLVTCRIDE